MKNNESIVGLSIVLKPTVTLEKLTPLIEWLCPQDLLPVWIPLVQRNGVVKAMPVLLNSSGYPLLLQSICQQLTQSKLVEWQGRSYEVSGVEIESSNLFAIQLTLTSEKELPATIGRAIHALFFQWLAKASPTLAEELHQQDTLPFTLSTYPISLQKRRIKITLLQQELLLSLLWGVRDNLGSDIIIAGVPCLLGKEVDILESNNYNKLANLPTQHTLILQMRSPTSFKQKQGIQPFPLPELVFGSLHRKWNAFAPEELHFPAIEWQGLVSVFELKTHALKLEGGAEIGTQGWVRYHFSNEEQARIATILAHFACFSGVGRKTTMGMGQVKLKVKS